MVKHTRRGNISRLDDELLLQILCRLGAFKYAIQCKSVCKFWYSAIDTSSLDSYFMCRWRQINNKEERKIRPVFVTQYSYLKKKTGDEYRHKVDCNSKELPSLDLNFMPSDGPICILSSCKDLLLCCPYPYDHSCYYLCNPFTKQWTTLPPPPSARQMEEVWFTEDIKVGFVVHDHDHARDINFTVLRIVPCKGGRDNKLHIFVFSSEGGGWRQFLDGERGSWMTRMFMVYYKGMLSSFQYENPLGLEESRIGFKLDAARGSPVRFVFPPNPETDAQYNRHSVIGVCRGLLRLAELVRHPLTLVVWRLYDGQEWDMVQELDIQEMVEGLEDCDMVRSYYGNEPHKVDVFVLAFHPHDRNILYLCFCVPPGKKASMYILSCHLKKRRLGLIRAIRTTRQEYGVYDVPPRCPQPGFFSIVPPCLPTPVPRLGPQITREHNC